MLKTRLFAANPAGAGGRPAQPIAGGPHSDCGKKRGNSVVLSVTGGVDRIPGFGRGTMSCGPMRFSGRWIRAAGWPGRLGGRYSVMSQADVQGFTVAVTAADPTWLRCCGASPAQDRGTNQNPGALGRRGRDDWEIRLRFDTRQALSGARHR